MGGWRLYADAGNTALKWAAWHGGSWVAQGRMEVDAPPAAWREIGAVLELAGLDADECEGVALVCSRPSQAQAAECALTVATGQEVRLLGRDLRSTVAVGYADPSEIGQDRLAAAEAALRMAGAPAIVLAVGTCITVQALDAECTLVGGAIAPGLEAHAAGIATEVPHLSAPLTEAMALVRSGEVLPEIGRSTVENLALGLAASLRGTVDALAELARGVVGAAPVIGTGGDAELAARLGAALERIEPLLVLEGLRALDERSRGE